MNSVGSNKDCLKLELLLDLVFQLSDLYHTLPGDGINEGLWSCLVPEMGQIHFTH